MTDNAHQQMQAALGRQKSALEAGQAFVDTLNDVRATLRLLKIQMGISPGQLAIANIGKSGTVTRPVAANRPALKANTVDGGQSDERESNPVFSETKRLNPGQFDQAAYQKQISAWVKASDYEINDRTGTVIFAGGKAFMDLTHFRTNHLKG